ncbi:MAG: tetratricopeptide repeat protein [Planctomycetota bacterium]
MDQEIIKIIQEANHSIKQGREKLEAAIQQLSELLADHPKSGSLCAAICHLYLVMERTDIPMGWLAQAIQYDRDLEKDIIAATTRFYQEGRLNESLELLERLVRVDPEQFEAWNDLGAVLFALNNWTRAKDAFEQALQLNPAYGESILNLTVLYAVSEQPELAKLTARKALDQACSAPPHLLKELAEVISKINTDTAEQIRVRAKTKDAEMGSEA